MKKNSWALIAIFIIAFLVISGTELGGFNFGDLLPGTTGGALVNVNKPLRIHLVNSYSGGAIASKTDKFNLYDSDGKTILEANEDTDANGLLDTSSDYPSGKVMYLRYEDSNDKQWFKFTVPQMNKADAESATYNIIRMESFTVGTYSTDGLKIANGTTFADASTYYVDASGENPHFTYSLANTGSDNTGLMSSYDPVYGHAWDIEFYITFSGTDYEKLVYHGFDYEFTQGTTRYVGRTLDPYTLTLHKVGADYVSLGSHEISFWIDTSGDTASTVVTMQIYVYAYASHDYAQAHGGTYGVEKVELAEHTVTIDSVT